MRCNFKSLTAIILVFCPVILHSDKLPPKSELCPKDDCRGETTIKLIQKDGKDFIQKNEYMYPIVQPMGGITIFPGEEIVISGDFVDGKLKKIRALSDSLHNKALVTFRFSQEKMDLMVLKVINKSSYDIKYHIAIMPLDKEGLFKTSSCPIGKGMTSFESWPYPIYQALISEIFITKIGDSVKCEY